MDTINKHMTNMISKLILVTVIMIAGMLMTNLNKSHAAQVSIDNIVYDYEVDGSGNAINVTVDGSNSTRRNVIYIPDTLDGHTVTSLGKGGQFVTGQNIPFIIGSDSVGDAATMSEEYINGTNHTPRFVIPAHVTTINNNAFSGMVVDRTNLNNLVNIGEHAFDGAIILGSVFTPWTLNLPNVQTLGAYAFANTSADSPVTIHTFVNQMNSHTEVTFGSNLTSIGENAFYGNIRLRKVTIPANVTSIGAHAFDGCTALDNLVVDTRSSNLGFGDFAFVETALTSVTIPANWTLGTGVFSGCNNLETATIAAGHTEIPANTFGGSGLEEITLPAGLTVIGGGAFSKTKLDTSDYNSIMANGITSLGDYAFAGTPLTGTIEVPNSVTTLGEHVFDGCTGIETATISVNDLEKLPDATFKNCESLATVNIPASVVEIGNSSFENCDSITIALLDNNILVASKPSMIIGNKAFKDCDGLIGTLTIPANVTSIGDEAFRDCDGLTGTLTINSNNITTIGEMAFDNCESIENIAITGSNLTSIGKNAFYNVAKNQKVIDINAPVTSIGNNAFTNPDEVFIRGTNKLDFNGEYRWYGKGNPVIHFADDVHTIEFRNYIPGVTITNNGSAVDNDVVSVNCDSNYTFKVNKGTYAGDVYVKVLSEGTPRNAAMVEEDVTLNENGEYTFENVRRNKIVIIQRIQDGTDLVLRTFISGIDEKTMSSRSPKVVRTYGEGIDSFDYNHTKQPLYVRKGQNVTYTIRVFNQGKVVGDVNEIKVRIPEQLKFVSGNETNTAFGWTASQDGRTITTTYTQDTEVPALTRNGRPQYTDVKIVCEVQDPSENDQYITLLAEISDGNDSNSVPNDSDSINIATYMIDESNASDRDTYVKDIEDDTDYETVKMAGQAKGDFNLVVTKLDKKTTELLDGAKIRLYDANMNEINTVTTQNGAANFGAFSTYGEGTDTYYIEEIESPVGYKRTTTGKVELTVVKELVEGELQITILCDANELIQPQYNTNVDYIPVKTAEQLAKIGSGEEITIDGHSYTFDENANYQLQNDIDLSNVQWTPINSVNGVFDGNKKKITNMTITDSSYYQMVRGAGMFLKFSGVIKDLELTVRTADTFTNPIQSTQPAEMGALAAFMGNGIVSNCKVNFTTSAAYAGRENVGGLFGYVTSGATVAVENCDVVLTRHDGASQNIGAIAGKVSGSVRISNCKNEGSTLGLNGNTGIGGFVGFGAAGSYILVENCNNKVSDLSGNENVGGIVGATLGGLTLRNCTNDQDITANDNSNRESIGGLVGYAEPSSYTPRNISVKYENGTITVYMENNESVDTFKLNVLKVNIEGETVTKLNGAKFNIYKAEGDDLVLIKENAVTENGVITLGNIEMSSSTNDVYYIKEIEAPAGYENVVSDYIKVQVTASWDSATEKYVINPDISLIEDIENDTTDPIDSIKGERVGLHTSTANVKWKTNKILIEDSTNGGTITGSKNIGGLVGCAKGFVVIANSNNELATGATDNIVAIEMNAGGIIGCASASAEDNTLLVDGCSNKMAVSSGKDAGGIVGVSHSKSEILDSDNTGNVIAENSNAAGIIAVFYGDMVVDGCTNKNNIIEADCAGGIVGALGGDSIIIDTEYTTISDYLGFVVDAESLKVYNCTSEGSTITANKGCAGGIIAANATRENIVEGCTVKNCSISGKHTENYFGNTAGIQGFNNGEVFIANDNNVINCDISATFAAAAGILGGRTSGSTSSPNHYGANLATIDTHIDNCHVYGGKISGNYAAGIMHGGVSYATSNTEITNCSVEKIQNGDCPELSVKYGEAAGILDTIYPIHGDEAHILLNNNTVSDAIFTYDEQGKSSGIVGYINCGEGDDPFELNVLNCKVLNTELNSSEYCAGIMGGVYSSKSDGPNVTFDNCEVRGVNINSRGNSAGILANVWSCSNNDKFNFSNCKVTDLAITAQKENQYFYDGSAAGILGDVYASGQNPEFNIDNCTTEHFTADVALLRVGGIIGNVWSYTAQMNISNSKCIGKQTANGVLPSRVTGGQIVGGIAGGSFSSDKLSIITIKDTICQDFEVIEAKETSDYHKSIMVGGIVGQSAYEGNIWENVTAKNITINVEFQEGTGIAYGGLVGASGWICASNVKAENINVDVDGRAAAAGFADADGFCKLDNIEIKDSNVNIKVKEATQNIDTLIGGVIANHSYATNIGPNEMPDRDTSWIRNIKINNVKLTGYAKKAGFVVGYENSTDDMFKVENVELKNSKVDIKKALPGGYMNATNIGNVIGALYASNAGDVIKGIDIENVEISLGANDEADECIAHVGGVVGICFSAKPDMAIFESINIDGLKINNGCEYKLGRMSSTTGGIVGLIESFKLVDAKFNNIEINNMDITGHRSVGGLVGEGCPVANNVTITNSIITAVGQLARAGGIAGVMDDGTELNNVTISADTTDTTKNYGVFSDNLAGGLAAICVGSKVNDTTIENITVKTKENLEPAGTESDSATPSDEGHTPGMANADTRAARYASSLINSIVTNVKLIIGTQETVVNE